MSRLTLRLPETLHQQLANLAAGEGVSLNQYIVYALTQQATMAYSVRSVPREKVQQQKRSFDTLLGELGKPSPSEISAALSEREQVPAEKELDAETVERFQQRIQKAAKAPLPRGGNS